MIQPLELARHTNRQTAKDTPVLVAGVHVLECGRGRRLAVIDGLVVTVAVTHQHEAAAADAGMVHPDDAYAERRADHGVCRRALDVQF